MSRTPRPRSAEPPLTQAPIPFDRQLVIAMLAPCPFPTRQGTQVLIRHLAEGLARAGHALHLITYGYGEYDARFGFELHRAPEIDAGLRSGPSLWKPLADAALLIAAAKVARAHGCDLWHVHNVEGLALGALLKLSTGLPLVYHAHNAMTDELPTYFRGPKLKALAFRLGNAIDRNLPKAADAVITFDQDHQALHRSYGVDAARIHVVPPGIDGTELGEPNPETAARLAAKLKEGPWLLYAGNPDRYQNLSLLWRALPLVRAKRPDARVLVASHHPAASFRSELDAAGSPAGVTFERYQTLDELKALYAVAALGLSPRSIWTGVPVKILNYLAAGLPVVTCRSGARHLVTPKCGRLVEATPEAFARGVLEVLEKSPGQAEIRSRAACAFSIDAQVPLYEAVYERVLSNTRRADSMSRPI